MGHLAVRPAPPPDARFWAKVDKCPDGCWIWTGAQRNGYGRVGRVMDGVQRTFQAHRLTYESVQGPVPSGLVLDHLCRNTRCVNPEHLEPVPQATNIARGEWFPAVNARKTHCPQGHPYNAANTYIIPSNNGRMCRICKAAGRAAERQRRQERARSGHLAADLKR